MLINETLRRGLQACAAQDDLREVVGQVVVEDCERCSISSATYLGASCGWIDCAGWLKDGLFCSLKSFPAISFALKLA